MGVTIIIINCSTLVSNCLYSSYQFFFFFFLISKGNFIQELNNESPEVLNKFIILNKHAKCKQFQTLLFLFFF